MKIIIEKKTVVFDVLVVIISLLIVFVSGMAFDRHVLNSLWWHDQSASVVRVRGREGVFILVPAERVEPRWVEKREE